MFQFADDAYALVTHTLLHLFQWDFYVSSQPTILDCNRKQMGSSQDA